MTTEMIIKGQSLKKVYAQGKTSLEVFHDVSLEVPQGSLIGLLGASGSGKSSLLHILGLLDTPTLGDVFYKGRSVGALSETEREKIRREEIGFIFQFHHLLPDFTAVENIMFPSLLKGLSRKESYERAITLLNDVGLQERGHHYPSALSGGEQQRVAIARAFAHHPSLILADEPTGNLDEDTAKSVFSLFETMAQKEKTAVFIVTHDTDLLQHFNKTYRLKNKTLEEWRR